VENNTPTVIRTPDGAASIESLYQLPYPGHSSNDYDNDDDDNNNNNNNNSSSSSSSSKTSSSSAGVQAHQQH